MVPTPLAEGSPSKFFWTLAAVAEASTKSDFEYCLSDFDMGVFRDPIPDNFQGLLQQLQRLSEPIILNIADRVTGVDNVGKRFYISVLDRLIYCRNFEYMRGCRMPILLLLKTGVFRKFILHICHTDVLEDLVDLRRFGVARERMLDEIQTIISRLQVQTSFVLDVASVLRTYRSGRVTIVAFCRHDPENFCGLMTSMLFNNTPYMCCTDGCVTLPSRRKSIVVVDPTGQVHLDWTFPNDIAL